MRKRNDPVLVIDAGAEPRESLRYTYRTWDDDHFERWSMRSRRSPPRAIRRLCRSTPGVRLHIVSGPTLEGKDGTIRFDVRIVKAEADGSRRDRPADQDSSSIRASAILNNVGGWVEVDDRGIVQRSDLNSAAKNPEVPARLLMMIVNARTSLARVVLPAQAVGIGARWEAKKELIAYGFKINQADTYTMLEKTGDTVKLNVQIQQNAPAQSVTFEEEGVELSLEALSMNATGEVVLNLRALEANAMASGEAADLMNVKTVDGAEKIEINSSFDVKMTVTYEIDETLAAGQKQLERAEQTRKAAEEQSTKVKKELQE